MEQILNQILEKLTSIEISQNSIVDEIVSIKETQTSISSKVTKNSLVLEKIQTDVKTLAEVQQSFSEQLDRSKNKDGKTLGERLDIIELAVTSTSKTLTELVDTIDVIKDTTGAHEMDIKILKKSQRSHFV